ncbi:NAD-dependent epimerase/dehydratase family protein [Aureimonas fodinaquatilis]|uniref:NAD-dependent epimerase/dehydratase family protein n=1 Tax=Aureimonas fodinaquatilis TaxID=2565783 RepID=A0A5B0DWP4_9HYPH|nr:NAD-dependent epimerase/dehydratase family protein [Aureimonas fodinaquatilis]KAA0970916.1 NAD-dependent epimerase/dehydratase family protein [Aureimonas fodinaquatilis]
MRILVSGSTGFIGRKLVQRLLDDGHDVIVLLREDSADADPRVDVLRVPRDLSTLKRRDDWPARVDAVVHLGGLNPERGDPAMDDSLALMRANAEGTAALARISAGKGARRLIFASSANIHSMFDGKPIIEDDKPAPVDFYAASKLEAERRLRAELEDSSTEFTILRLPAVYGPGGRGAISMLERLAKSRMPLPFRSATNRRSVLALDNAVDAFVSCLTHPGAAGRTFLVADRDPVTLAELVAPVRAARGRGPGMFSMPVALLKLMARMIGRGATADRLFSTFVIDTSRIRSRIGWRPRLSTAEALMQYNKPGASNNERS